VQTHREHLADTLRVDGVGDLSEPQRARVPSGGRGGCAGAGAVAGRLAVPLITSPPSPQELPRMARVVVDVMLKPEILDPQGQAVAQALPRLGFDGIADVRQGKRFELELEGEVTEERLAQIRGAAETLLSNPVIEDFTVRVEQQ
jgi:phosphoribosylformylglycinamidine synthase PurS subunit